MEQIKFGLSGALQRRISGIVSWPCPTTFNLWNVVFYSERTGYVILLRKTNIRCCSQRAPKVCPSSTSGVFHWFWSMNCHTKFQNTPGFEPFWSEKGINFDPYGLKSGIVFMQAKAYKRICLFNSKWTPEKEKEPKYIFRAESYQFLASALMRSWITLQQSQ